MFTQLCIFSIAQHQPLLTAVVPVLDAEDEVGPVVVLRGDPGGLADVDEWDVEVRVQEDGRGHEEGQHADEGQDQQGLE